MSSPKAFLENNYNLYCPVVSLNKTESLVVNGEEFLTGITRLLAEFGVRVHKISRNAEYMSKKGTLNYRLRLIFSSRNNDLINLYTKVGFEYNRQRSFLANAAAHFLRYKKQILQQREEKEEKAIALHRQGLGAEKNIG